MRSDNRFGIALPLKYIFKFVMTLFLAAEKTMKGINYVYLLALFTCRCDGVLQRSWVNVVISI